MFISYKNQKIVTVKQSEESAKKKKGVVVKMVKKTICKSEKKGHAKKDSGGALGKKKRGSEGSNIRIGRLKKRMKKYVDEGGSGSGVKVSTLKVFIYFYFFWFRFCCVLVSDFFFFKDWEPLLKAEEYFKAKVSCTLSYGVLNLIKEVLNDSQLGLFRKTFLVIF